MAKIIVGCRLPHGIILNHPLNPEDTVELNGLNKVVIVGADHATTEVDEDFWGIWKTAHKDFQPLKSGAIFEAKNVAEAKGKGKELKAEKTGFEKVEQTAMGVKKADKE